MYDDREHYAQIAYNDENGWDIKTVWGVGYRFEVNDGQ